MNEVQIYTDGACKGNPGPGGWGAWLKSGATEMVSGDANPMRIREREWEAIDLIEKALVTQDGPFSWEGKFFTHPHVNIWPRPYQQPRPEFWAATSDLPTCAELGRRNIINTLFVRRL